MYPSWRASRCHTRHRASVELGKADLSACRGMAKQRGMRRQTDAGAAAPTTTAPPVHPHGGPTESPHHKGQALLGHKTRHCPLTAIPEPTQRSRTRSGISFPISPINREELGNTDPLLPSSCLNEKVRAHSQQTIRRPARSSSPHSLHSDGSAASKGHTPCRSSRNSMSVCGRSSPWPILTRAL